MIPNVTFHDRSEWEEDNYPVSSGYAYRPLQVTHGRAHYTAAANLPDGDPGETTDLRPFIRGIQRDWVNRQGYSAGYNFAVDWRGHVWEIRGFDFRCAANNGDHSGYETYNLNRVTIAVLFLVDGNDGLNDAMARAGREIYREAERRTVAAGGVWVDRSPRPHSESDYTSCPGPGIRADIAAGRLSIDHQESGDHLMNALNPPSRWLSGESLVPGTVREFDRPYDAVEIEGTLTVATPAGDDGGYVVVWPEGPRPNTADIQLHQGRAVAAYTSCLVGGDGKVRFEVVGPSVTVWFDLKRWR